MVNKCTAYGCTSGYYFYKKNHDPNITDATEKITFHSFPFKNQDLFDKWIRAISRDNFVPSKWSRLCSLHFHPTDFVENHTDSNLKRKRIHKAGKLAKRYLKEDAVPSIFQNAPKYLSRPNVAPRPTSRATTSQRQELEALELNQLETSFLADDDISGLHPSEIGNKLNEESTRPEGFFTSIVGDTLLIYMLGINDDIPKIQGCIIVKQDHQVVLSIDNKITPASQFKDLIPGTLKKMSQLINLMARVKAWCENPSSMSFSMLVNMAINCLNTALTNLDDANEKARKISFIVEQLELAKKKKFGRQYSPQLTIFSYMVQAASTASYNVILDENVLSLPSVNTLRKVSRRLNSSDGLDNRSYLKLRVSKLNQYQRNVLLMIDEIYIAKRVEYSRGEVQGLTPDGSVATTLLCFMVKSLAGKYKDLVAIYPITNLTASKQYECYKEVVTLVEGSFTESGWYLG